jgi:vacuolar protein sorting-associated protein 45
MQRFVDAFPEFKALSGNVSKHVTLMHVLSDTVKRRQLLRLSELEQDLACSQDHAKAIREIFPILEDPAIAFEDKARVVALYALRYERENNQIAQLKGVLRSKAQSEAEVQRCGIVDEVLRYAGAAVRGGDLFGNKNMLSKMITSAKSSVKGVDNIYTQHKPVLLDTLRQLAELKLTGKHYPYLDAAGSKQGGRYRLVVVYMAGGVTFEEVLAVHDFNSNNAQGMRCVIAGSEIHNSRSFIDDVLTGQEQTYTNQSNGSDFS